MRRPVLLFACHPLTGHITPVLRIAAALRARGWRVAFLSSAFFRARIEAAGLDFLPLLGSAALLDDDSLFDRGHGSPLPGWPTDALQHLPEPIPDARFQTLAALPDEWTSLKAALHTLAVQHPGERLLVVSEAFFYGAIPLRRHHDALPAAVLPRSVCVSITAPVLRSADLPPFGEPFPAGGMPPPLPAEGVDIGPLPSVPPDTARQAQLAALWEGPWRERVAPLTALLRQKLREACSTNTDDDDDDEDDMIFHDGAQYRCHDAIAQVGVPAFEYPRSDWPPGFRFVGIVPPAPTPAPAPLPSWWDELVANGRRGDGPPHPHRKQVVVVAQGTVETDPALLIGPTLQAMAGRADVLVVGILGRRMASQDAADRLAAAAAGAAGAAGANGGQLLPANARIAGYLAYDAVLPLADAWVHNGGYGAVMHGVAHGLPQVVAGATQDKPENGRRVAWSGLGVDLGTAQPPAAAVRAAVSDILANSRYAQTAAALQAAARATDLYANMEALLLEEAGQCGG